MSDLLCPLTGKDILLSDSAGVAHTALPVIHPHVDAIGKRERVVCVLLAFNIVFAWTYCFRSPASYVCETSMGF
jgi:hypothetical protein